MFEIFNENFASGDSLAQPKSIPPTMQQSYKRLINASPKARISVGNFLEQGKRRGGFFETPLIKISEGVENLGMKNDAEKEEFLK
jgi:SCY1-like protein 1